MDQIKIAPPGNPAEIKTARIGAKCIVVEKDNSGYGYKYADLPSVMKALESHLKAEKLGIMFDVDAERMNLELISVCLETGDRYLTSLPLKVATGGKMNEAQAFGSSLTYAKRYLLQNHFNISADQDVDANTAPPVQANYQQQAKPQLQKQDIKQDANTSLVYDPNNDAQKIQLGNMLRDAGIRDKMAMKSHSDKLCGKTWSEVDDYVHKLKLISNI